MLTLGSKPFPKGGQERENEAHLHTLPEEMQEGMDCAEGSRPAALDALCGYTPGSFLLLWRENGFFYVRGQSCKAPNPHSEIPSLTQV